MNQTLLEKVQCMLSNVGLDKVFWVNTVVYACHLINHLSSTTIGDKTLLDVRSEKSSSDYKSLMFLVPLFIIT